MSKCSYLKIISFINTADNECTKRKHQYKRIYQLYTFCTFLSLPRSIIRISNSLKFHSYFFFLCSYSRSYIPADCHRISWNCTGVSSVVFFNEPAKSFFYTKLITSVTCELLIVIHLTGFLLYLFILKIFNLFNKNKIKVNELFVVLR